MKLLVDIDERRMYAHHKLVDEFVYHHKAFVFIDDFMLYFRPKAVYQRLYLQFEIVFFFAVQNVTVYAVNFQTVFLPLRLRRVEFQKYLSAFDSVCVVTLDIEFPNQPLVQKFFVVQKPTLQSDAYRVRRIVNEFFRLVLLIHSISDYLFFKRRRRFDTVRDGHGFVHFFEHIFEKIRYTRTHTVKRVSVFFQRRGCPLDVIEYFNLQSRFFLRFGFKFPSFVFLICHCLSV